MHDDTRVQMITEQEYQKAQEIVKKYEKQRVLDDVGNETDYVGKLAMCWYPKNKADGHDLELYFCRVLSLKKGDKVTAQLYHGETYNPMRIKGTFNDVCFEDLSWDKKCFE